MQHIGYGDFVLSWHRIPRRVTSPTNLAGKLACYGSLDIPSRKAISQYVRLALHWAERSYPRDPAAPLDTGNTKPGIHRILAAATLSQTSGCVLENVCFLCFYSFFIYYRSIRFLCFFGPRVKSGAVPECSVSISEGYNV